MKPLLPYIYLLLYSLIMGCIGQDDGRKGRALIQDFTENTLELCNDFMDVTDFSCISTCPSKTHIATRSELEQLFIDDQENTENNSPATIAPDGSVSLEEQLKVLGAEARGFCISDITQDLRPNLAVKINNDFCSCINKGKRDILNDCDSFCSSKTHDEPILYVNTTLSASIQEDPKLGSLERWCNATLDDGNGEGAICRLKLQNGSTEFSLELLGITSSNGFTVNIQQIPLGQTFVATLVEDGTGSNAKSTSFQIRRIDTALIDDDPTGPLKVSPVAMYTCLAKFGGTSGTDTTVTDIQKIHYFYPLGNSPPALPGATPLVDCHDISLYGSNDSAAFPRLELIPLQFSVWNDGDIRFFDRDGDDKLDIHKIIEQRLLNEFGIVQTINLFSAFRWPNRPNLGGESEAQIAPRQGFIMQPSLNESSNVVFCPTQEDYHGNTPLFKILRNLVGVDTEGLYVGIREAQLLSDNTANPTTTISLQDTILIPETLLKKIWFYYQGSLKLIPNTLSASQNTVHFYWPADTISPLTKKSDQQLYTIRRPEELGVSDEQLGIRTNFPAPDKRFACVPKTD